jgi:predicted PurR-regulated permease PerM
MMNQPQQPYTFDRVVRLLIGLSVSVALVLLIGKLRTVLLPFAVGWLLAYLLHPVVLFFQCKLNIRSRILSILCTVLLLLLTIAGVAWFTVPLIGNEIDKFVQLVKLYTQDFRVDDFLPEALRIKIQTFFSQLDIGTVLNNQNTQNILRNVAPKLWSFANSSLSFVFGFVVIFVVFLYFIFISLDYDKINAGFIRAIPEKYRPLSVEIITDMKNGMNKYFRGQALIALINGILFSVGFSIIGLPMGILLGVLMGILNLIPYMQLLGYIPALLLALLRAAETGQSYWTILLWLLLVAVVVQAFQEMVLTPKIMGKATGLNPAVILLSLSVWGSLLGLLGLIIALPITTLLLSYYERFVLKKEPLPTDNDIKD